MNQWSVRFLRFLAVNRILEATYAKVADLFFRPIERECHATLIATWPRIFFSDCCG
ncbi:MAG: hypothetical protein L0387_00330 [Acidobacteria bacterium]|nr:hypothetical protein [Acidobacteriota bacterium]